MCLLVAMGFVRAGLTCCLISVQAGPSSVAHLFSWTMYVLYLMTGLITLTREYELPSPTLCGEGRRSPVRALNRWERNRGGAPRPVGVATPVEAHRACINRLARKWRRNLFLTQYRREGGRGRERKRGRENRDREQVYQLS